MTPTSLDPSDLDAADPLAPFRERFVIGDDLVAYLDGNSLGRLPLATRDALSELVEHGWGHDLIRGWEGGWVDLPSTVGDELGEHVLGVSPGTTVVADSTTVCLFKAVHAAAGLRPERSEIVAARDSFPTDRYVVEAVAEQRGLVVRWLDDVADLSVDESTAVVLLDHVDFRTGALLDLPSTTAQVHAAGAVVLWDLCHSAGVVPLDLAAADVDLAVGCTYKFLNAGPGAPAFLHVAPQHLPHVENPVPGWWGAADLFAMSPDLEPAATARRMLSGTPNVAGLVAVREGVRLVAEAGLPAIRAKSVALTGFAIERLESVGLEVVTPREGDRRGSTVTVRHPDARALTDEMARRGVVPDFRGPDLVRLGLSPLTTSYAELAAGLDVLVALAAGR